MKLGLIARCDQSGLGIQTWEFARHMKPKRVLLVRMGAAARGPEHPDWYAGAEVIETSLVVSEALVRSFVDGLDMVFTCEGTYYDGFGDVAAEYGCRTVVQANPELYRPDHLGEHVPVFPTSWELDRYDDPLLLPVPVARDRLPYTHRTQVKRFVHVAAPAMLDRNGTDTVLAALGYVDRECEVVLHVPEGAERPKLRAMQPNGGRVGNVELVLPDRSVANYWDIYEGADALLLPRRYGGLSLPMQEAASLGMPIVTTDLSPQNEAPLGAVYVEAMKPRPTRMKGGHFDLWHVKPARFAAGMNALLHNPDLVSRLSEEANYRAEALSWQHWEPEYRERLESLL